MPDLNQTPSGERVHISIFGRRNCGKSSLINALTDQALAIVSDVPGTTTDPVSKSMEILPIGPVVVTDTAGIDDVGDLGQLRVEKTLRVLEKTDFAVLIVESGQEPGVWEEELTAKIKERGIPMLVLANKIDACADYSAVKNWATRHSLLFTPVSALTRQGIEQFKSSLISISPSGLGEPSLIGDLISEGDIVVLVVPIDKAAPKGRLILPQVMTIRDALDHDAIAVTVKERGTARLPGQSRPEAAHRDHRLAGIPQGPRRHAQRRPDDHFSILMARYKGDLAQFVSGARAIDSLKIGSRVLISEGCTHHAQADDIGRVQIPRWLRQMVGGEMEFGFSSGKDFPPEFTSYDLIVHCGGCMLNRREMLYRQRVAAEAQVPMTNYGVLLAKVHGILDRALPPFPLAKLALEESEPAAAPKVSIRRTIS